MSIELASIAAVILVALIAVFYIRNATKPDPGEVERLVRDGLLQAQAGNDFEAEYLLTRALDILERNPNADFSQKTSCIAHLANSYSKSGKYAESRELYERLASLWNSAISAGNPQAFLDMDYLASTVDLGSGTNYIVDCYPQIIEAKKKLLGINHSDVVSSLLIYSRLLNRLGRHEEAKKAEAEADELKSMGH